ncbi:MAG: PEP/pyruvate-binding domain-containing protein [Pseudomonadota bacterium]
MAELSGAKTATGTPPSGLLVEGAARTKPERAGGKAAALALLGDKFDIPPFVVISADAFDDTGMDETAQAMLVDRLETMGTGPFAVRSSGREEDGIAAAHAGQFDTELNVDLADVPEVAHRVWRSGFSDTLADYRRAKGLSDAPQPPAVIVQKMVQARAAGVTFSADPLTGDRDTAVISAVEGLADQLVSGDVDGDQYWVDTDGVTTKFTLAGAGRVLSGADVAAVADLARRAAMHFRSPQDVEWAFQGDRLFLLQSRPITTLPPSSGVASQSTPAKEPVADTASKKERRRVRDDAVTIWDNSNIVESYPGVVSPLTFSFARYVYAHVYTAFSQLMGVPKRALNDNRAVFENMLGRIDGRVYYNLLNWYRALALFPGFKANRAFMEGMMGVDEKLPDELAQKVAPESRSGLAKIWDQIRLGRVALGLIWHDIILKRTMTRFYDRLNAALAKSNAEIDAMPASELAAEYRRLEQALLARWDAPLINDFLCMIAFGASRKAMERWAGDPGLKRHADMLIGQGDIISAEPARLIREMGALAAETPAVIAPLLAGNVAALSQNDALEAAFERYIGKFGDRCAQELKLESLTLHDDPTPLLKAVGAAARAVEQTPGGRKPVWSQGVDTEDLFEGRPVRGRLARWLMTWAKARVRDRENLRFERTRLFGRVRRIFLALGRRLESADVLNDARDVFYLTVDEVLGAVEGAGVTQDLKALASLRHNEMEAAYKRPDPPERMEVHGAHLIGVADAKAAKGVLVETGASATGLACCQGVVTAKVRVVTDPRREALSPGEILVARHTDPGWIAVFANAAGVIAERGSLLSHSAIVAREMGVPCVVALKGATQWLKTGDLVRLDGGTGEVVKLEETDAAND